MLGQLKTQNWLKVLFSYFKFSARRVGELVAVLFTLGSSSPVACTTRSPGASGASKSALGAGTRGGNQRGVAELRGTGGMGGS